jgi:hypothetical protein
VFAPLAALEAKLKELVTRFDGEAVHIAEEVRDDALAELEKVKAEAGKVGPLLTSFEADVKAVIAADGPGLKADLAALVEKLLADAAAVFGSGPAGM